MSLEEPCLDWALRLNAAGAGLAAGRAVWRRSEGDPGSLDELGWAAALGRSLPAASAARRRALDFDPVRELERAGALGAAILRPGDDAYPDLLASIPDPPPVLYCLGRLENRHAVAVVGTRTPTPYGRRMAARLAGEAAERGLAVASGLARGVDAQAHRACLDAGGPTWAVLGSGLNRLYPPEHAELAERVARQGVLLSEWPLDSPPLAEHFPRRNRVVSGLSWAVVVVEGRARSGSLLTARAALEQGREVFAVPGPADSPESEATAFLLREGAAPACRIEDILESLPPGVRVRPSSAGRPEAAALDGDEGRVLSAVGSVSLSLEEICAETGLDTSRVSSIIFGLEMRDRLIAVPGQRYAQKSV